MPRLTFENYLKQRAFLKLTWDEFDQLYSLLSPNQQADLHRYYQPLHDYSDTHLRKHKAHVTELDPALRARAGRSYARLHRVYEDAIDVAKRKSVGSAQRTVPMSVSSSGVTVRAVLRTEPDLYLLSQALIELARERIVKEGGKP